MFLDVEVVLNTVVWISSEKHKSLKAYIYKADCVNLVFAVLSLGKRCEDWLLDTSYLNI